MTTETIVGDTTTEYAIRKALVVKAPALHTFTVFTERIGDWWPRSHHIGELVPETVIIEPRVGGRVFERASDSKECQWGKVLDWTPPERIVFGWQLNADFQFDPNFMTEVELRFISEGPDQTRVEFEHRRLDRYGDRADEMLRVLGSPNGWVGILDRFHLVAEG